MARKKTETKTYRPWEDPELVVRPVEVSPQHGLNRQERRHGYYMGATDKERAARRLALTEARIAGANVPFVGTVQDALGISRSLDLGLRRKTRHRKLEAARRAGAQLGDVRQVVDLADAMASGDWR